jgi:membrane protein required for colicin V production
MWYDVLAVGVLVFAVIRGAAKGIVWQLATIAALVLCFAFSESLSLAIAPYITVKPPLNRWLAMFGLYVFFSFLSFAAARRLRSWIEKAQFVEYDRHLGSVFGFVKGVVFVLVMTFFAVTLTQQMPETRNSIFHSQTGKISAIIMDRLHPVMPDELHAVLEPYIHSLDRPGFFFL